MLKYILRLDDATPVMNAEMWLEVERLLDKYCVKPIVGVIPDNHDPQFRWDYDDSFWQNTLQRWIGKGWTIAQHGYRHVYHECSMTKTGKIRSEFAGLTFEDQVKLIDKGYQVLLNNQCTPSCFYAPAHSYDDVTYAAIRESGRFRFISDGYALYPYSEKGNVFIPVLFDTPHKLLPFGVYTFVYHPSYLNQQSLVALETFLKANRNRFSPVEEILSKCNCSRKRNMLEVCIEKVMCIIRITRRFFHRL